MKPEDLLGKVVRFPGYDILTRPQLPEGLVVFVEVYTPEADPTFRMVRLHTLLRNGTWFEWCFLAETLWRNIKLVDEP